MIITTTCERGVLKYLGIPEQTPLIAHTTMSDNQSGGIIFPLLLRAKAYFIIEPMGYRADPPKLRQQEVRASAV